MNDIAYQLIEHYLKYLLNLNIRGLEFTKIQAVFQK